MGKGCSCCKLRRDSLDSDLSDVSSLDTNTSVKWSRSKRMMLWGFIILAAILFLAFILIWVIIPISFWLSIAFQRLMVFIYINSPSNPQFDNPGKYGITGVQNFYITVKENDTMTKIGAWMILPEQEKDSTLTNVSELLENSKFDVLLYLHGVLANRAKPIKQYEVLRQQFLVIAIDHRGYGDSGEGVEMSETGIVNDHLQIYDWVAKHNLKGSVYYWGHSLGTALTCHTVRALKEQHSVVPKGMVLEAPFTTYAEEILSTVIGKMFQWLAYFDSTVIHPLHNNGFRFLSTENILHVDCPIMVMNAEDDNVIPYTLGQKLAEVASTQRDLVKQGNVTYHLFSKEKGYGHNDCTQDPAVPQYISEFKKFCEEFAPAKDIV
ncbi:lysophosphatidylserine lipase ABHD12-like [Anthonomus grandis grandis]|uniref:lysophosphatidylserine lipase ABHD12-like n=1 Tax=Anthonomus grandis grandis TaxID=2921223 RepID=UPI002166637D|nr:lysophosphatidylserine lipase ABHD12-like [Anthonomus grandis grandis]